MSRLEEVFPAAPANIPPDLTAPTKAYLRHARLATVGLLGFVAVYMGFIAYLSFVVWRLLGRALLYDGDLFWGVVLAAFPLFLLAFLVRGLFVVKHSKDDSLVELTAQAQPTLFAFLERLARDTGAPRPHKVFASARVNAAVFYDLSFRNLLFPSKKNLELGLGLVNALSLDELKAVIAHELGHFAQRTMAVGRWVYVAQQIAGHIVVSRGRFDGFLRGLSNTDPRLAWVGWVLRLFVWAIRAVLDTAFRLALLADRALSREMEFQADRVAVSVSGSDSLIHALHRLGPADGAWEEAMSFAASETYARRTVDDLFVFQTAALEHLRRVFDEPGYGLSPAPPTQWTPEHRVFTAALAQPPRMWSTHPPNREREDSAKATYVPSVLDARPAWSVFVAPEALRAEVTRAALKTIEPGPIDESVTVKGTQLERFSRTYLRPQLDAKYRGAYLDRAVAAYDATHTEMIGEVRSTGRALLLEDLAGLYPTSLRAELQSAKQRREEAVLLEALKDGILTAPGGVVRHRGREVRRRELPSLVQNVKDEQKAAETLVRAHDRKVRATHLAAAKLVGQGWPEHLERLVALLHCATHISRNIHDAHGHLRRIFQLVVADGNVSRAERLRLVKAANEVSAALEAAWVTKAHLTLAADVKARFDESNGWATCSQTLGLLVATEQNLANWLEVVDGWALGAAGDFSRLAEAALDVLLESEAKVAHWVRSQEPATPAPEPSVVPQRYATCVVGAERERPKKLDAWSRFQVADGALASVARFGVACALLMPAFVIGGSIGSSTVHVINGLSQPVEVTVGGRSTLVNSNDRTKLEVEETGTVLVTATVNGEEVESFSQEVGGAFGDVVYVVGHSAPLVEWYVRYGSGEPPPERRLGAPRWFVAKQNHIFQKPPSSAKEGVHSVLEAVLSKPEAQLALVSDESERAAMILSHVRFDRDTDPGLFTFLAESDAFPEAAAAFEARAWKEPRSLPVLLAWLDRLDEADGKAACARAVTGADDEVSAYLEQTCLERGVERMERVRKGAARWPSSGWFAMSLASLEASEGNWEGAVNAVKTALKDPRLQAFAPNLLELALRVERLSAATGGPIINSEPLQQGVPVNASFELLRTVEHGGSGTSAFTQAAQALRQGDLERVQQLATEPNLGRYFTPLLGASEGASRAQVEAALALDPSSSPSQAWALAALASREGKSWEPYAPFLTPIQRRFFEAETARVHSLLELDAKSQRLIERQKLLAMGVIVLGKSAPARWRSEAKAGLFTMERPFFR